MSERLNAVITLQVVIGRIETVFKRISINLIKTHNFSLYLAFQKVDCLKNYVNWMFVTSKICLTKSYTLLYSVQITFSDQHTLIGEKYPCLVCHSLLAGNAKVSNIIYFR